MMVNRCVAKYRGLEGRGQLESAILAFAWKE
jgi:hypothetical protein